MESNAPEAEPVAFGWRPGPRTAGRQPILWVIPLFLVVATSAAMWVWTLRGGWADYAERTGTPYTYWRYEVSAFTTLLAAGPLAIGISTVVALVLRYVRRSTPRSTPLVLDGTGLHHRATPGGRSELVRWNQVTSVEVVHDDGPRLAVHVREPQRLAVAQRGRDTAPEARSRIAQHGTPLLVDLTCLAASEEELVDAFARFGVRTTGTGNGAEETLHAARPARHTARRKALAVVGWTLPVAGAVVLTVLLSIFTAGGFDGVITGDSAWEPMVASLCLLVVGAGWLAHLFGTMPHHHLPSGPAVSVDASGFRERTSGVDVGRVRWAEVVGLRLDDEDGARRLVVRVHHPRDVARRATNPLRARFYRSAEAEALKQHERYGSPVVIHLDQVADPEALVEAFRQRSGRTVP